MNEDNLSSASGSRPVLRIGLLGAGTIGRIRAQSLHASQRAVLAGVADVEHGRAAAAAARAGCRVFGDYRALLDTPLDAVVISSPVNLHEEMAIAAFDAGLHVLCEKPLSNDTSAAKRMLDAARSSARTLAVGFNHRYFPSFKYLRQVLASGRLGEVMYARALGGHTGPDNFEADWMRDGRLVGGGAMMDLGIHLADLLGHTLGPISEVYGLTSAAVWKAPECEDNAIAIFKAGNDVPVLCQSSWSEWKGYRFWIEVYGTGGFMRAQSAPMFNRLVLRTRGKRARASYRFYPWIALREKFLGWQTTVRLSFDEEIADFIAAIEGGEGLLASGEDGLRALAVCQAVYESQRRGEPVTLPE